MLNWNERKTLKRARELVAGTRKLLRIHADVLEARAMQEIRTACDNLAEAVKVKNVGALNALGEHLEKQLERLFPRQDNAALRENVEVLLVAVIVAMAVRTFFVQPFKIPTGSMQPTLFGIIQQEAGRPSGNSPLQGLFDFVVNGKTRNDGVYTIRGDHIFVDKFSYHFRKPNRGEVIVFQTSDIPEIPESSRGQFFIKRLIGLGGDKIEIQPPKVLVNGEVLDSRPAFERIYSMENGYNGYVLLNDYEFFGSPPKYLNTHHRVYEVPAKHLFVLGDNSRSSLDGRFWGSLPEKALVGRAVFVYWPFTGRFGLID